MKRETQALHLAKMVQRHMRYQMYELTLPFVTVRSNKLKKLSLDDILLTGLDRLEFLLLDSDNIRANTRLKAMENVHGLEIVYLNGDTIKRSDSKKYEILKISFGTVQSKSLEIGSTVDITHINLEKVTLVLDGKTIAEGSLVNVDQKIAIQIRKVN